MCEYFAVSRLTEFFPLNSIGNKLGVDLTLTTVQQTPIQYDHAEYACRDSLYHLGRIRYFMNYGDEQPIQVDCCWSGITPVSLVLLDGHHRLAAAILSGQTYIAVEYSGPTDWLQNLRCPK